MMRLHYSGDHSDFPVYVCDYAQSEYGGGRCQEVRALGLDAEIERLVLEALKPDQLTLALAALDELAHEFATLRRQRELHLERLRYEVERARRQYDVVEPENRLVARSLESAWEGKLRALEKAQQEHNTWLSQQSLTLSLEDRQAILAPGQNLPAVWYATSTTAADRFALSHVKSLSTKNGLPAKSGSKSIGKPEPRPNTSMNVVCVLMPNMPSGRLLPNEYETFIASRNSMMKSLKY